MQKGDTPNTARMSEELFSSSGRSAARLSHRWWQTHDKLRRLSEIMCVIFNPLVGGLGFKVRTLGISVCVAVVGFVQAGPQEPAGSSPLGALSARFLITTALRATTKS